MRNHKEERCITKPIVIKSLSSSSEAVCVWHHRPGGRGHTAISPQLHIWLSESDVPFHHLCCPVTWLWNPSKGTCEGQKNMLNHRGIRTHHLFEMRIWNHDDDSGSGALMDPYLDIARVTVVYMHVQSFSHHTSQESNKVSVWNDQWRNGAVFRRQSDVSTEVNNTLFRQ